MRGDLIGAVEKQQRSRRHDDPARGRDVADQHEPPPKDPQGRGQAETGRPLEERGCVPGPPAIVGGGATSPFGVSLTIVVPVPWALAPLLKLETRTSPGTIVPPEGKPRGTIATP